MAVRGRRKKEFVADALEDAWRDSDIESCEEWTNTEEAIAVADKAVAEYENM